MIAMYIYKCMNIIKFAFKQKKTAYKEAVLIPRYHSFIKQLLRSFIITVFNRILILLLLRIFSWILFD